MSRPLRSCFAVSGIAYCTRIVYHSWSARRWSCGLPYRESWFAWVAVGVSRPLGWIVLPWAQLQKYQSRRSPLCGLRPPSPDSPCLPLLFGGLFAWLVAQWEFRPRCSTSKAPIRTSLSVHYAGSSFLNPGSPTADIWTAWSVCSADI